MSSNHEITAGTCANFLLGLPGLEASRALQSSPALSVKSRGVWRLRPSPPEAGTQPADGAPPPAFGSRGAEHLEVGKHLVPGKSARLPGMFRGHPSVLPSIRRAAHDEYAKQTCKRRALTPSPGLAPGCPAHTANPRPQGLTQEEKQQGTATLPQAGEGGGESLREDELGLQRCRRVKWRARREWGEPSPPRAPGALGRILGAAVRLSGAYLSFFGGGPAGAPLRAFRGSGGGGREAGGATGLQVVQAAEVLLPQGQQLLQVLQAVLGARQQPRPVPLLLQAVQAAVHAADACGRLQGLAEFLPVVPDHVHGAAAGQPHGGAGRVVAGTRGHPRLPLRARVKDGVQLSEHSAGFLPAGAFQLPAPCHLI